MSNEDKTIVARGPGYVLRLTTAGSVKALVLCVGPQAIPQVKFAELLRDFGGFQVVTVPAGVVQ